MSDMPNDNPKKLVHSLSIKNELYSGPIPSPEFMEKFKQVQADFPERIMKLTESEDARRTEIVAIEKMRVTRELDSERRAQILTFVCFLLFLAVSVAFVLLGQSVPAILSSIVPILWALRSMFAPGKRPSGDDPEPKKHTHGI